jgi:hypothetical protein
MKQILKFVWLASLLALLQPGTLLADEEEEKQEKQEKPENARSCINVSRIRNTTVVDDSSILFYMRGRTVYLNILRRQCRGLAREGRFSYRASGGSLCHLDSIRILYGTAAGIREGASCGLGYFQEVTEEDLELILEREPAPPQAEPLPPAEPEDMTKETDES